MERVMDRRPKEPIPSPKCDDSFHLDKQQLGEHVYKEHKGEKQFMCSKCNVGFEFQCKLKEHLSKTHNCEKRFTCPECHKGFDYKCHLKKHSRMHTGETPFICGVCKRGFRHISHLKRHMQMHTGQMDECDICGKETYDISGHMRSHFTSTRKRDNADGNSVKRFQCLVCSKDFGRGSHLKLHMLIHTGEKPFPCSLCHKSFIQLSCLRVHQRVHTHEKPYRCKVCHLGFTASGNFNKHMRIKHDGDMELGEKA